MQASCVGLQGLARQGYRGVGWAGEQAGQGSKLGRATGGLAGQDCRGLAGKGYRELAVWGTAFQRVGASQVTRALVEARKASCYQETRGM